MLFSSKTDNLIKQRVTKDILNSDTTLAVDCIENLYKYPFRDKLKTLNKTIYLINSNYFPTDTAAFLKNKLAYKLLTIDSTGHYPMIEKPDEFNALLQQAIDNIKESSTKR